MPRRGSKEPRRRGRRRSLPSRIAVLNPLRVSSVFTQHRNRQGSIDPQQRTVSPRHMPRDPSFRLSEKPSGVGRWVNTAIRVLVAELTAPWFVAVVTERSGRRLAFLESADFPAPAEFGGRSQCPADAVGRSTVGQPGHPETHRPARLEVWIYRDFDWGAGISKGVCIVPNQR